MAQKSCPLPLSFFKSQHRKARICRESGDRCANSRTDIDRHSLTEHIPSENQRAACWGHTEGRGLSDCLRCSWEGKACPSFFSTPSERLCRPGTEPRLVA